MTPNATIARITSARIVHYVDNGETRAYIGWVDSRGRTGETSGHADSAHMQALLARARREGIRVKKEQAGWLPNGGENIPPKLRKAYDFFRAQGGGVVGQSGVNALALARAEAYADENDWAAEWEDDPEPYDTDLEDDQPFEVLTCVLKDESGNVLASLGSIGMSGNARQDRDYRRVIEAELALQAMSERGLKPNGSKHELAEMEELLARAGYDPDDAKKLQREGIGPSELEERLRERGGLSRTHGLQKSRALAPNVRTTWTDAMILQSVRDHHGMTPQATARAYELEEKGLIDMSGTWRLTRAGQEYLRRHPDPFQRNRRHA